MTPWKHTRKAGLALLASVVSIYLIFADFSVLKKSATVAPPEAAATGPAQE